MTQDWMVSMQRFKTFFAIFSVLLTPALAACSTNPATGQQQFTALMSPGQEVQVGASEHQKIAQQFGFYDDAAVNAYVTRVGRKVTTKTERPDVQYKFFVLDSPIVNAFALPGGYIYVSRGLLALAGSEAELAAVLAHETGHITGRHSAERYSRGVVTTLGAGVLSAVLGSDGASQALGLGANLYLSAYSRGQESEADSLGLRYMNHGGYDVDAMAKFLGSLKAQSDLDSRLAGNGNANGFSYFSTHPATADRVAQTRAQAGAYPQGGLVDHNAHLKAIDGMIYGDSEKQGFVRGQSFYHPQMGFTFSVPEGFNLKNSPAQISATSQSGAVLIFDMAANKQRMDPRLYVQSWVKDKQLQGLEAISVNGRKGATASFTGSINGRAVTIRLVAIEYGDRFARFQMAIPQGASAALVDGLKSATYSFRDMSASEKQSVRPYRIDIFAAQTGDSVSAIARRQPFTQLQEERFRVLNGLNPGQSLQAGQLYKKIVE
ncbi:MAG: M48 family metalloprotease [Rhodospirillales bacterium]|nr:M48 family metalloprotease [Rhodospirillales bacterium]